MITTAPILTSLAKLMAAEERPAEEPLEVVCAWCQKLYGWPKKPNQSHGICAAHRDAMLADLERLKHIP